MISKTAQADVEDLREAGLEPTFGDIIRLNALGLAVERSKARFALSILPRVAFLDQVAFREPTIGSEIWLAEASRLCDSADPQTFIILRAFSLSRPQGELPDPSDEKALLSAIDGFRASLGFATVAQIVAAVSYAVHGFEQEYGEAAPPKRTEGDSSAEVQTAAEPSYEIGLLRQGMLCRIGSAADLRNLPPRALQEMIVRAISRDASVDVRKDAASEAEDDYLRALDQITARLKSEAGHQPAEWREQEGVDSRKPADRRECDNREARDPKDHPAASGC